MGERRLSNWIQGYVDSTEGIKSPVVFRQWAGLFTIAAVMERKCFVHIDEGVLYPNLYIWLVGPPAVGKTRAYFKALNLLRGVATVCLTPDDVTQAAFYDCLEGAVRHTTVGEQSFMHHSLTAVVDEVGTFIKPGDNNFRVGLTKAYDCSENFSKLTKHSGENSISNVWFNMGAGATPRALADIIDEQAIEQGFSSRIILVYSDERQKANLFGERQRAMKQLDADLLHDLEAIHMLKGEFVWSDDAAESFLGWHESGMNPKPDDARLFYYNERRIAHVAKLCMVLSAARADDLVITLTDFQIAVGMLTAAEANMHLAVAQVAVNKDYLKAKNVVAFVKAATAAQYTSGVPIALVLQRLNQEVGAAAVDLTLQALLRSGELVVTKLSDGKAGIVAGS